MKVYGSEICGDCRAFKALMVRRGLDAEFVDIAANTTNLRAFLTLRDGDAAFAAVREEHRIGIPAFVREDGAVTLDANQALAWIGQPPMEDIPGCENCQ